MFFHNIYIYTDSTIYYVNCIIIMFIHVLPWALVSIFCPHRSLDAHTCSEYVCMLWLNLSLWWTQTVKRMLNMIYIYMIYRMKSDDNMWFFFLCEFLISTLTTGFQEASGCIGVKKNGATVIESSETCRTQCKVGGTIQTQTVLPSLSIENRGATIESCCSVMLRLRLVIFLWLVSDSVRLIWRI